MESAIKTFCCLIESYSSRGTTISVKNKRIVTLGFNLSQHLKLHYNNLMRHQSFVIVQLFLSSSPQPLFNNGKLTYFEHFLWQVNWIFSLLLVWGDVGMFQYFFSLAAASALRHGKKVSWLSCKNRRKKFFISSPKTSKLWLRDKVPSKFCGESFYCSDVFLALRTPHRWLNDVIWMKPQSAPKIMHNFQSRTMTKVVLCFPKATTLSFPCRKCCWVIIWMGNQMWRDDGNHRRRLTSSFRACYCIINYSLGIVKKTAVNSSRFGFQIICGRVFVVF